MLLRSLADIRIPWESAEKVFDSEMLPAEVARTARTLPNTDALPDDCFGAFVSLVLNRGAAGFDSSAPRYSEMRAIKRHMADRAFALVPEELRKMKRLWPESPGFQERREEEAALFERGLAALASRAPLETGLAGLVPEGAALPVMDVAPDRVDLRDLPYRAPLVPLPDLWPPAEEISVHLESYCADGMILDQGREGACTGYGLAACINFLLWRRWVQAGRREGAKPARASPKMLYELARPYDEWPGED